MQRNATKYLFLFKGVGQPAPQDFQLQNNLTIKYIQDVCFNLFQYVFTFSRMRSKGSRFTLGSWGLKSATVRNRPQLSA